MACTRCGASLPGESLFCNQCGSPQVLTCGACKHDNAPGSRFCGRCGMALDAAAHIASRLSYRENANANDPTHDTAFVRSAFKEVLGFAANDAEVAESLRAMDAWRKHPEPGAVTPNEDPARAHLIWAMFNHNDFVTLR